MTGLVHGLFAYFYEGGIAEITVWELNLGLFLFYLFGYNLRHTHIWLPYPRWLSHILVSPAQHQIHHSDQPRHFDKNIGFIFAFWDWAAGTLYVPKHKEDFAFGLYGGEHRDFNSVWKLYALPFKKAAGLLRGGKRSQA
jgi:sterol desaturase/sphingolipid hydroxylase (fatty acid hydroxylase superfamily)